MRQNVKNKVFIPGVILLAVIAVFLRFNRLGDYSFYSFDSATTALATKAILKNGYPLFDSGNIYPRGLLHNYLNAFVSLFFGLNELSLRLVSAVSGVLVVILVFFMGRKFFSDTAALLSSLFMCFSLWAVEFSRYERFYALFQLLFFAAVYFFYAGFFENRQKYRYLFILAYLAALFTHLLGVTLLSLFLLFYLLRGRKALSARVIITFCALTIVSLFWMFFEMCWLKKIIASAPILEGFSFAKPYFIYYFFRQFGIMAVVVFLGLIQVIYDAFIRKKSSPAVFVFGVFIMPLFGMGLISTHHEPRYNYFLLPFFVLLFFYCVLYLAKKYLRSKAIRSIFVIFFIIIAIGYAQPIKAMRVANRKYGENVNPLFSPSTYITYYPDHRSPAEFVKDQFRSGDIILAYGSTLNYFYLGRLDYVILGNISRKPKEGEAIRDPYTGVEVIYSPDRFSFAIKNKRAWLITTGIYDGAGDTDLNRLISGMRDKAVFTGRDGHSRVYLLGSQ